MKELTGLDSNSSTGYPKRSTTAGLIFRKYPSLLTMQTRSGVISKNAKKSKAVSGVTNMEWESWFGWSGWFGWFNWIRTN